MSSKHQRHKIARKTVARWALTLGAAVLGANALLHALRVTAAIMPVVPAAQTALTTASFLLLYLFLWRDRDPRPRFLLPMVASLQFFSLLLLAAGWHSQVSFFLPSSLPTSLFLLWSVAALAAVEMFPAVRSIIALFATATLAGATLLFVFAAMTARFYLLGISPETFGVGVSFYTVSSCALFTVAFFLRFVSLLDLHRLSVEPRIATTIAAVCGLLLASFSIQFCVSPHQLLISALLHTLMLSAVMLLVIGPYVQRDRAMVTLCAWTDQVKTPEGDWVSVTKLLTTMGFAVSHGLSPQAADSVAGPAPDPPS